MLLQQQRQPQRQRRWKRWIEQLRRPLAVTSAILACVNGKQPCLRRSHCYGALTPSSSRPSNFCRGITVTSSISQRKPTSDGVRPGGSDSAILYRCALLQERSNCMQTLRDVPFYLGQWDARMTPGKRRGAAGQSEWGSEGRSNLNIICTTPSRATCQLNTSVTILSRPASSVRDGNRYRCAPCTVVHVVPRRQSHCDRTLPRMYITCHGQVRSMFSFFYRTKSSMSVKRKIIALVTLMSGIPRLPPHRDSTWSRKLRKSVWSRRSYRSSA